VPSAPTCLKYSIILTPLLSKMDSSQFKELLKHVTRIADALEFQQELNYAALKDRQANSRDELGTCTALISAANRMGKSLERVSSTVDSVNEGRKQSIEDTLSSVRELEKSSAEITRELENAGKERWDAINKILSGKQ
jgi:methyl-accepting chemotaxis protein